MNCGGKFFRLAHRVLKRRCHIAAIEGGMSRDQNHHAEENPKPNPHSI